MASIIAIAPPGGLFAENADLISPISEVPGLGSTLCANFYVGPHIPLFLEAEAIDIGD